MYNINHHQVVIPHHLDRDTNRNESKLSCSGVHLKLIAFGVSRRSELICRIKWNNSLPDLPFDPKFITYPFESNRFVSYKPTSLEKTFKHDLVTEHDLGVTIDLINPDTYAVPPASQQYLQLEDERLLEEDPSSAMGSGSSAATALSEKRSKQHNKVVPWLKKTEYISTEFNRYGASSDKSETKVGYNVKKKFKEDLLYMDRESQIAQINKTFEETKKDITTYHHPKKDITPVSVHPIFPDFDSWKYPFAQVTFDAEPVGYGDRTKSMQESAEEMSQAMIRGVMDESGEQFVAYFLPTQETLTKRKRDAENKVEYEHEEEYEYKMAREYNWNVKNKTSKGYEENYFFLLKDDAVFYNELETRVRLTKRRSKLGSASNSRLIVKHRALNDQEFKTQDLRLTQLMPAPEEEVVRDEMEREKRKKESAATAEANKATAAASVPTEGPKSPEDKKPAKKVSSGSDSSGSSSASGSSAESSSSSASESESEDENDKKKSRKAKKDEAEIFGSDDSE